MTDEEILTKLRSNRRHVNQAVTYLADHAQWRVSVTILLRKYGVDKDDFDSVLFESLTTFCSLIKQGKYKTESNLKTFFEGVCRNVIRNKKAFETRYAKRITLVEPAQLHTQESYNPFRQLSHERDQSLKELFRNALERLGEPCKKSLIMKVQGFKDVEIADELNVSHGGIRKRLFKCREQLRKLGLEDATFKHEIDTLI